MSKFIKESLIIIIVFFTYFLSSPILQAIELDLTSAQNAVGKRFASKFCEAKQEGFSSDTASEFALNNTYLKFVAFPDDEKFIEDLWEFTLGRIRNDCGSYVNEEEEINLRDFFEEEGEIASNRDLYLPH
tara:strand:+ start:701 stop:1090 length:390 start_codon:yes stop_codon:yes gene_type:complete